MPTIDEFNLTLLATLQGYLDPPSSNTTILQALINRASSLILGAANVDKIFVPAADITERRNGNGQRVIIPKMTPIVSVTSVTVIDQSGISSGLFGLQSSTTIPASDGTSAGYIFDDGHIYLLGYTFPRGIQNVTLVYKGGIAIGSQVQLMLEQACIDTCSYWWKMRPDLHHVSVAQPQGMGTITFTQKDLPLSAQLVVEQIKRVAPVVP